MRMNRMIGLSLVSLSVCLLSLSGCKKNANEAVMQAGPCTLDGSKYVETEDLGEGISYRKCWSPGMKRFVTEIFKDGKNVALNIIPTDMNQNELYSPALDLYMRGKLEESGNNPDVFADKEEIGRVKLADLNFDGKPDLWIYKGKHEEPLWKAGEDGFWMPSEWDRYLEKETKTIPHPYYDGLLWHEDRSIFAVDYELYSVASPVVNEKDKTIQMIRMVQRTPMGTIGEDYGEDDYSSDSDRSRAKRTHQRYSRGFVKLGFENGKFVFKSAASYISCADYTKEIMGKNGSKASIVGETMDNTTCVYCEYSYDKDEEHRTKSYVPVEDLSAEWRDYIQQNAPRKR